MRKMAGKFILSLAAAGLLLAVTSATAQSNNDEEALRKAINGVSRTVASSVVGSQAGSAPPAEASMAMMGAPMAMGMSAAMAQPQGGPSSLVPQLELRDTIRRAMESLSQLDRDQLAQGMVGRNVPQLMEGEMGDISITDTVGQVMTKVRDQMFQDIHASISQYGQTNYRSYMQPQVIQTMITAIRPWDFPNRFKSQMIPILSPSVGEQIKEQRTGN